MPYETSPEIDFSAIGLVVDVPANAVPTGGWSNSLNVRCKNNSVQGVNSFADDIGQEDVKSQIPTDPKGIKEYLEIIPNPVGYRMLVRPWSGQAKTKGGVILADES